ncbi:MAG: sigma-54-dependent transcriptional regulator, partial [Candidatus Adiutrix sp.]
ENIHHLLSHPVGEGASDIAPIDVAGLMALARAMHQSSSPAAWGMALIEYLKNRFGMTFMSILWPARPPANRLISFMTSHDDKRLLLSQTPFLRTIRDHEAILWPSRINELQFKDGQRHVNQVDEPVLIGPLLADRKGATGLLYIENTEKHFNKDDLNVFSALLLILSPAITSYAKHLEEAENRHLPTCDPYEGGLNLTTSDDQVKIIFSTATQVAATKSSVMICGEAGTGKGALGRYIHNISPRKHGRLVKVGLSAIPANEIERALLGQNNGSGDGDVYGQIGFLELADGGTLFLRHIEYLPANAQKILLMAMEEGLFMPLAAGRPKAVDLRVICTTSVDLWARVEAGYFREDLYVRLNNMTISMPPLREIKNDLEWLANNFMSLAARDMGLNFTGIDPAVME